mgnify:CR=1 FL=1
MDLLEYNARGRAALNDGELDLAEQYFRRVLQANPENQEALDGLKALEVCRAKKSWSPITWGVRLGWALILLSLGKAEAARPSLEIAHRCWPNNRFAALAYAKCARGVNHLDEAHDVYQNVLAHLPNDFAALKGDADVLIALERYEEATERLQRLHAMKPNDEQIEHQLRDISALSYSTQGIPKNLTERRAQMEKQKRAALDNEEFMDELESMKAEFAQHPENLELGVKIAQHYRRGKHYSHAAKTLGPILDQHPGFEPARLEQARIWRQTGELALAVSLYEEFEKKEDLDYPLIEEILEAKLALAQERAAQGEENAAAEVETLQARREENRLLWLQKHLREHPEDFAERAELGELFLKQKRYEEAITTVQRLVHEPSWAGRGFYLLGLCFYEKGDIGLAVQQLEKSLDFFKNKSYQHLPSGELKAVYYTLGEAKEALNDLAGARDAYGEIYAVDINYRDVRERYERTFNSASSS